MKIRREDLKQAIDAIASFRPEAAHTLNTMLAQGMIDVLAGINTCKKRESTPLFFRFCGRDVPVNKYQFFNDGTAVLEQALVSRYGEMAGTGQFFYFEQRDLDGSVAMDNHRAGPAYLVDYEIERACQKCTAQLKKKENTPGREEGWHLALARLNQIRHEKRGMPQFETEPKDSRVLFRGIAGSKKRAVFHLFPFCREALIQAAELNLEFFHVRFLLDCLVAGTGHLLFGCSLDGRLEGLVFLEFRKRLFYTGLEIKYIATRTGSAAGKPGPGIKGAGTFLVAGVWMLWKSMFPRVSEIFLESEIPAGQFYTSLGFHQRRPHCYVLTTLKGRLLNNVAAMAAMTRPCSPAVVSHLCRRAAVHIRCLKQRKNKDTRKQSIQFLKTGLHPAGPRVLAETVVTLVKKNRSAIPEADALLDLARAFGRISTRPGRLPQPAAVVLDERYCRHLEGITHLESRKRILAMETALGHPSLKERWFRVPPRMASPEELAWVHSKAYIQKIQQTAGKPLQTLDLDTQTTEGSWDTARLAAGGVFTLADAIMQEKTSRGFACVRPPGHHAGVDRAMGFCIFNNAALGARYLQKVHKVSRVMIIDIDAHHGNGTQEIFYGSNDVLFFSIHEKGSFPGTGKIHETGRDKGKGFTINIPLDKGSRARDIGRALYFIAGPVAQAFCPDVILVSLGFDLFIHDRLTGMKVSKDGYAVLTCLLLEIARLASAGKILFILEGGYSLQGIRTCGLKVMEKICGITAADQEQADRIRKSDPSRLADLQQVVRVQRPYWNVLL